MRGNENALVVPNARRRRDGHAWWCRCRRWLRQTRRQTGRPRPSSCGRPRSILRRRRQSHRHDGIPPSSSHRLRRHVRRSATFTRMLPTPRLSAAVGNRLRRVMVVGHAGRRPAPPIVRPARQLIPPRCSRRSSPRSGRRRRCRHGALHCRTGTCPFRSPRCVQVWMHFCAGCLRE